MEAFQKYENLLKEEQAKKIVKNYNKTAKVLIEFEVRYHQAWLQQVQITVSKHAPGTESFCVVIFANCEQMCLVIANTKNIHY